MSRRTFSVETERSWLLVDTGWDPPLGHFFLTIKERVKGKRGAPRTLYSNLGDPEADLGGLTIEQVAKQLEARVVTMPEGLVADLTLDRTRNQSIVMHDYGTFKLP